MSESKYTVRFYPMSKPLRVRVLKGYPAQGVAAQLRKARLKYGDLVITCFSEDMS